MSLSKNVLLLIFKLSKYFKFFIEIENGNKNSYIRFTKQISICKQFSGLETVNYVRLIDCQMERIRRDAFKEMENVGSLELVDNQIHLIDAHAFNISVIRFEGNKIYCGCQNMWLLAEQVTPLTVLTNNYCSSPMAFENRALIDIDKQYIQNCSVNGALLWSSMAPIVTIDPSTTVLTFILLLLVGNLSP